MVTYTYIHEKMLCRFVDDYLFVTADKGKAMKFLDMMVTGMLQYTIYG
jgi:hypothetical protein